LCFKIELARVVLHVREDHDGKSVGVIEIPVQDRPFFLTKSYGRCEANVVYIRRGDTTSAADPDEIAQMGAKAEKSRSQPVLQFAFANLETRKKLDGEIRIQTLCFEIPDDQDIPGYGTDNAFGISLSDKNEDFYADMAMYLRDATHLEPFAVVILNESRTTAEQVVARIRFAGPELEVFSPGERRPEPTKDRFGSMMRHLAFVPGVSVIHDEHGSEVSMELGDIQPGTSSWSRQPFYLGCRMSTQFEANIVISGHNLAEPIRLTRQFDFQVETQRISVDQVIAMADRP
jgi:hypothetical protein